MNALAADQARRIAQTIDRTPALRGRVTAGVFVGRDNQPQRSAHKTMGRDHVVTDRDTLRDRPPDILLTNYKMLDYLLVRPFDFRLWRHNGPGHAAVPGGRRAARVRRRPGDRPRVPDPAAAGAARGLARQADLRRDVGHPRRGSRRCGAAGVRLAHLRPALRAGGDSSARSVRASTPFSATRSSAATCMRPMICRPAWTPRGMRRPRHTSERSTSSSSARPSRATSHPTRGGRPSGTACASTLRSSTCCACSTAARRRCRTSLVGCVTVCQSRTTARRSGC